MLIKGTMQSVHCELMYDHNTFHRDVSVLYDIALYM